MNVSLNSKVAYIVRTCYLFLLAPKLYLAVRPLTCSPIISRVEQSYQKVMALWHQLHVNTKSLISWNYLRKDLDLVQTWDTEKVTVKLLLPLTDTCRVSSIRRSSFITDTCPQINEGKWSPGYISVLRT